METDLYSAYRAYRMFCYNNRIWPLGFAEWCKRLDIDQTKVQ